MPAMQYEYSYTYINKTLKRQKKGTKSFLILMAIFYKLLFFDRSTLCLFIHHYIKALVTDHTCSICKAANVKLSWNVIEKYLIKYLENLVILVMQKSQSHRAMKVSKAVVVSIDEVKGQGPLDGTTTSAWSSTYQTGSTANKQYISHSHN